MITQNIPTLLSIMSAHHYGESNQLDEEVKLKLKYLPSETINTQIQPDYPQIA